MFVFISESHARVADVVSTETAHLTLQKKTGLVASGNVSHDEKSTENRMRRRRRRGGR